MTRKSSFEENLAKNLTSLAFGRGRRKGVRGGIFAAIVAVILISWLQSRDLFGPNRVDDPNAAAVALLPVADRETVSIERCVDGDTFVVKLPTGTTERVRLIGANTPETVKPNWPIEPFGPEASAYSKRRVEEASGVATLVADGDRRDKFGRRLAFLYLADDEISLNEELVRQGLAKAETKYRYSSEMKRRLTDAEDAARREGRGMHGAR